MAYVGVLNFLINNINIISILAFYAIIGWLIYKNKHKIQSQYKVFLLYRTKRGLKTINWLGQFKRFWKGFGYVGVPIGFAGMVFIIYLLFDSLINSITNPAAQAGVRVVIPGIGIPFWYGIISLILLVVVHEGAHGIIARAHDIKVKNTGVGMMLFLPLAFVEPDEKDLRNRPARVQLSVFSAGSIANFCLAGVAILLGTFLLFPAANGVAQFNGLEITDVVSDFPAESAGVQLGDLVTSVNGVPLTSTDTLVEEFRKISPGDEVQIGTLDREISIVTTSNPTNESQPYIGVSFSSDFSLKPELEAKYWKLPWLIIAASQLLLWIIFLNIGIGLFNLLPLAIVDGGRMASIGINKVVKNRKVAKSLFVYVSLIAASLLLLNLFSPLLF